MNAETRSYEELPTPGHWMYQRDDDGVYQVYAVDTDGNFASAVGEADEIADAALMAASPRLAAALRDAYYHLRANLNDNHPVMVEALVALKDAGVKI